MQYREIIEARMSADKPLKNYKIVWGEKGRKGMGAVILKAASEKEARRLFKRDYIDARVFGWGEIRINWSYPCDDQGAEIPEINESTGILREGAEPTVPARFYTATPAYRYERIKTEGLVPSAESRPGEEPGVYLSHQMDVAVNYAKMNFGENDAMEWAILEIDGSVIDPVKLVADNGHEAEMAADDIMKHGYTLEQIWTGDFPWWISLAETGQVVYLRPIPPSAIRVVQMVGG